MKCGHDKLKQIMKLDYFNTYIHSRPVQRQHQRAYECCTYSHYTGLRENCNNKMILDIFSTNRKNFNIFKILDIEISTA
jgi:hypothetical protein